MRPDELQAWAARCIPGDGPVEFHRLGDGLVNDTYRVVRGSCVYALRVATAEPNDLGLDRAWEARVLEFAWAAGLSAQPVRCDPLRGILLTHWIEGSSWTAEQVRRQSNIGRIAQLARRIHGLPLPEPVREMNPGRWIDYYGAALLRRPARSGGRALHARESAEMRAAAAAKLARLAALPSVPPVICHGDMHVFNLLDRGRSLALLDWEYAHASDPLWDLAGWSANNDLPQDLRRKLLESYLGRAPAPDESSRLQLLAWLYDYVCILWSELYSSLHSGAAAAGVAVRAKLLEARLAMRD